MGPKKAKSPPVEEVEDPMFAIKKKAPTPKVI